MTGQLAVPTVALEVVGAQAREIARMSVSEASNSRVTEPLRSGTSSGMTFGVKTS